MNFTILHRAGRRDERGSISLFMVSVAVSIFLLVGLVVDGSGQVKATQRADNVAAEAARRGASAMDAGDAIQGKGLTISGKARAAAQAYLSRAGVQGSVSTTATKITVTTRVGYSPIFLPGSYTVTGNATARLVRNLDGER